MNVPALYRDMKRRGILLKADGERLLVDAPAGELSEQDRAALAEVKPALLCMLAHEADEERRLLAAGWSPKERGGMLIWANPQTGFYCSQEVALHRLDAGRDASSGTFATQKSARVMGSGEGVADDPDGKP